MMDDDLISRREAAKIICNWCRICPEEKRDIMNCDDICPEFARIPSAQPERKKGKWINAKYPFSKCGICECYFDTANNIGNYCPNCGAKMEGETDETD